MSGVVGCAMMSQRRVEPMASVLLRIIHDLASPISSCGATLAVGRDMAERPPQGFLHAFPSRTGRPDPPPGVTGLVPSHAPARARTRRPRETAGAQASSPLVPGTTPIWRSVVASPPILDALASDAFKRLRHRPRCLFHEHRFELVTYDVAHIGV